jgi:hypothetical protein
VLRRGSDKARAVVIDGATVTNLCQLNNIDRASREDGVRVLQESGRIVSADGSVAVLGATTGIVLETAAEVFENSNASGDEHAVLTLSEEVASRPVARRTAEQLIGDLHHIRSSEASDLVDLCKTTAGGPNDSCTFTFLPAGVFFCGGSLVEGVANSTYWA